MSDEQDNGRLLNVVHVNVNVTDIEHSVEFYKNFGFEVMHVFSNQPTDSERSDTSFTGRGTRGAVMSISDDPRASCKIELIQSLDPTPTPQPERRLGQAGVGRIAIRTKNMLAYMEKLAKLGIEPALPVQEIDIVGARRYAIYHDPDGVLLELIEF